MKRFLLAAAAVVLFVAPARAEDKIVFAGLPNIAIPAIVASEKGFFADEGVQVEFQNIQTGKLAMEAVLAGRAQFASVVVTNVAYAGFLTDALRIIASNGLTMDDAVVFPEDSPIRTAKDLKGKRIGLAMSTSSQDFLIRLLAREGLDWKDITPVPLQPPTGLAALKGGQIDAFVTWQPWRRAIAEAYDGNIRTLGNDETIYPRQTFYVGEARWLREHADGPPKILRALIRAEAFCRDHPDEAVAMVAKRAGLDSAAVQSFFTVPHITMNAGILPLITSYATWVVAHQEEFLNKPLPDYRKNLAPEFMKAIAPERVEKGL